MSSTENRRQVIFSSFSEITNFVYEQFREYEMLDEQRPPLPRVIYVNPDVPEGELSYHYDTAGRMVFYIHPRTYRDMLMNSHHEFDFGSSLNILNPIGVPIVRESAYRVEAYFKQFFMDVWYGLRYYAHPGSREYQELLEQARKEFYPTHHREVDPSQRRRPQAPTLPASRSPDSA